MMRAKSLGIILARGGSKGIPRKNIKVLNGLPMIAYTIKAAQQSELLDRFVVSTEDPEIKKISRELGAYVIDRPVELAGDDVSNIPVWKHAISYMKEKEDYDAEVMVQTNPTNPLRTAEDIDSAIKLFYAGDCRAVLGSVEVRGPIEKIHSIDTEGELTWHWPYRDREMLIEERQKQEKYYILNGAVTVVWCKYVMAAHSWKEVFIGDGGKIKSYPMPAERSIDVDDMSDFNLAEYLLKNK